MAAALLVGSVAIMALAPDDMTLDQAMAALDEDFVPHLQALIQHMVGPGIWGWMAAPLLIRPCWFAPLCLGLICVGSAMSLETPPEHSTRKRS